eukprot:6177457-Pleurochrysis_carterae.AAC.1
MARYGKRKYSGSTTRRVKSRTVRRRTVRKGVRKLVARRRVAYGSFQATWIIPITSLASPLNKLKLRCNFIHTGALGTGAAIAVGTPNTHHAFVSTQVPKGYDRLASMCEQCRVYKSKARFAVHNLAESTGAIHITGYVHDDK